jgi:hypothetical protein
MQLNKSITPIDIGNVINQGADTATIMARLAVQGISLSLRTMRRRIITLHSLGMLSKTGKFPAIYTVNDMQMDMLKSFTDKVRASDDHSWSLSGADYRNAPRCLEWGSRINGEPGTSVVMLAK